MITKLVAFRLPSNIHERLQEKCSDEGTNVSEKLRYFIDGYLLPASQTQATSPAETDEVKEPSAEQPILEERVTQIEERIGQLPTLEKRVTQIEQALPQAADAVTEDKPPEPGKIDVEEEHLGRVQGNPEEQKEEPEKEKEEDKGHWPFNIFFKETEKEPEKKDEVP